MFLTFNLTRCIHQKVPKCKDSDMTSPLVNGAQWVDTVEEPNIFNSCEFDVQFAENLGDFSIKKKKKCYKIEN